MVSKLISFMLGKQTAYRPEDHTIETRSMGHSTFHRLTQTPEVRVKEKQLRADAEKYPIMWISFMNDPNVSSPDKDTWFCQAYQERHTAVTAVKADLQAPLHYNYNCNFSAKPSGHGAYQLINMGIGGLLMVDGDEVSVKPVATTKDYHTTFQWQEDKYLKTADANIYLMRDENTEKIVAIRNSKPTQTCTLQSPTEIY